MQEQLAEIGLDVEIRELAEYATSSAYLGRLGNPDEPWDMAFVVWSPDYVDPFAYLNRILDTQDAGGTGLARFAEAPYIGLLREAARRSGPRGRGRTRRSTFGSVATPPCSCRWRS